MNNFDAYIFKSELKALCYQAAQFPYIETGGDLYGTWTYGNKPVIHLATGPGPGAVSGNAKFSQDHDYIMKTEKILFENFGIQYIGDWHSHHVLGLQRPSGGDQRRINNIMRKTQRKCMFEIIVNHKVTQLGSNKVQECQEKEQVSSYIYLSSPQFHLCDCKIGLLDTSNSVIRQYLSTDERFSSINLMNVPPQMDFDRIIVNGSLLCNKKLQPEEECFADVISLFESR